MRASITIAALWIAGAGLPPLLAAHGGWPPPGGPLTVTVTPGTISFQATDPDAGAVSGSTTASVSWAAPGYPQFGWSLTVQADSGSFASCPAVPVSAITVSCTQARVYGSGGSGVCGAATPLSLAPPSVATGTEGYPSANYLVTLRFTLSDSWKYIAQLNPPCSLFLSYTVNLQ